MFVERLNEEDIRKFLGDNIRMDIKSIEMKEGQIDVCLEGVSSDLNFTFTDFGVEGHDIFAKAGASIVAEKWSGLMHAKFGREYVEAWLHEKQSTRADNARTYSGRDC
ncbi:MAG: hypothetical protein IJ318_03135 [Clostridia bacterium]|nr:hypothetical protein [Clostridia bacterium]